MLEIALQKVGRYELVSDLLLFAMDPGETVGYAVFRGPELLLADQSRLRRPSDIDATLTALHAIHGVPDVMVVEAYRIYPNRAKQHINSDLFTPRVIGGIEVWSAIIKPTPKLVFQMASQAKGFATDRKLRDWGLYQRGARHANDAIRHAVYYLLFGPIPAPEGSG